MSTNYEIAHQYALEHASKFQEELFELLRIPSLSGNPDHADDVRRAAEWLAAQSSEAASPCWIARTAA